MPRQTKALKVSVPTLADAHRIAKDRGGKLISKLIANSKAKVVWQCSEGHRWKAQLSKVKRGTWCAVCAGRAPLTIRNMQAIAKARGGQCLSLEYLNNQTRLLWRCAEGHEWRAMPRDIRRSWCPVCAGTRKLRIDAPAPDSTEARRSAAVHALYQ